MYAFLSLYYFNVCRWKNLIIRNGLSNLIVIKQELTCRLKPVAMHTKNLPELKNRNKIKC